MRIAVVAAAPEILAAAANLFHGVYQLGRRALFRQVAERAGGERAPRELRGRMHAEDEHRQARMTTPDVFQQVETAFARQRHVEHHEIPPVALDARPRAAHIARFADAHVLQAVHQDLADAMTDDGMVVDKEDADHVRCGSSPAPADATTETIVPLPGFDVMLSVAPISSARSRMPSSPIAVGSAI